MNKIGEPRTDAEASAEITPAQVAAWMHHKIAASGLKNAELLVATREGGSVVFIVSVREQPKILESDYSSPENAFAKALALIPTPEQVAAQKREQAAKLMAEAESLLGTVAPPLVILDKEGAN